MGKACSRSKRKQIEFKVYNNVNWEVKKWWDEILKKYIKRKKKMLFICFFIFEFCENKKGGKR